MIKDYIYLRAKDNMIYTAVKDKYPWFKEYLKEQHKMNHYSVWAPYVDYKIVNYHGEYVNIDENGHRKTYNIYGPTDTGVVKIFFYGGSTSWGWGARDEYTIPSYLSRILNQSGIKVYVENHGTPAYVSTQDFINFLLDIRKSKPDIAVFYQGINELFSAFFEGKAGTVINAHIKRNNRAATNFFIRFIKDLYKTSGIRKLVLIMEDRLFGIKRNQLAPGALDILENPLKRKKLIEDVVNVYYKNLQWINAIAEREDIKVLFYWQPVLYTKETRTPYEDKYYKGFPLSITFFEEGYSAVKNSQKLKSAPNYKNISHIFRNDPRLLFFDSLHIFEEGNKDIAELMARDIKKLIRITPPTEKK